MANVWAARLHGERGFTKLVAVKTMHAGLATMAEFERMFMDEARIASQLSHPNVCQIFELGEEQSTLYIAMEWVNGDSLMRLLRSEPGASLKPLECRFGARLIADACAGLHAAHELCNEDGARLDLVHRDISPQNLLVALDGHLKVADFGIVKAKGRLHETSSDGGPRGKVAYMAPEQLRGESIDRRCDIFSLGCVLYEATTGHRPFRGSTDAEVIGSVLFGRYDPPWAFVPRYPTTLNEIITRSLRPDPDARYQTAEHLQAALEAWLVKHGTTVTRSQIAAVVRDRLGEDIEIRRLRIRDAVVARASSPDLAELPGADPTRTSSPDAGVSPIPPSSRPLELSPPEPPRSTRTSTAAERAKSPSPDPDPESAEPTLTIARTGFATPRAKLGLAAAAFVGLVVTVLVVRALGRREPISDASPSGSAPVMSASATTSNVATAPFASPTPSAEPPPNVVVAAGQVASAQTSVVQAAPVLSATKPHAKPRPTTVRPNPY